VGAAAVQLSATSRALEQGVLVRASNSNTNTIYLGASNAVTADTNAATDGYELGAGEAVEVEASDLDEIWLISDAAAQKVFYIAV